MHVGRAMQATQAAINAATNPRVSRCGFSGQKYKAMTVKQVSKQLTSVRVEMNQLNQSTKVEKS